MNDGVPVSYLQNNYSTTTETTNYVNQEITGLATIYQSINTTLDEIPLAESVLDLNGQKISNV